MQTARPDPGTLDQDTLSFVRLLLAVSPGHDEALALPTARQHRHDGTTPYSAG